MSRKHGLEQIRLLALGRDAGGRAAALHVDAHQGKLGDGGQTEHLGLQRHPRARCRRHRLLAGERRAHDGPQPRDLVLGLQHRAAVTPEVARERLHDFGGGRDGITSEEVAAGEDGGRRAHLVAVGQQLSRPSRRCRRQSASLARRVRVGVGEAGGERALASFEDLRTLARELAAQALEDRPRRQPEPARE